LDALDRTFEALQDLSRGSGQTNVSVELLAVFTLKFLCDAEVLGDEITARQTNKADFYGWRAVVHEAGRNDFGERLSKLARSIESHIAPLKDVFTRGLLSNVQRFDGNFLHHVVFQLSTFSITDVDDEGIPVFARWFDRKLSILAESYAGESVTPKSVAQLMVKLADLRPGMTILDPCCGTGAVLALAAQKMCVPRKPCRLYGQEINVRSWSLCKLRLFLLRNSVEHIILGDALRQPAFASGEIIKRFDRVMCDMPFGLQLRGDDLEHHDLYGRFRFGKSSRVSGESAFVQLALSSLAPKGIALAVVSHAFLFRAGGDARIREGLIESGYIKAVIGLPGKLRAETGIETALILFEKDALPGVLFIDAAGMQERVRGKAELSDETILEIWNLLDAVEQRPGVSRLVPLEDLREAGYSLVPKHYMSVPVQAALDIESLHKELQSLEITQKRVLKEMDQLLKGMESEP
jgi:type I restriction enzyme M protein